MGEPKRYPTPKQNPKGVRPRPTQAYVGAMPTLEPAPAARLQSALDWTISCPHCGGKVGLTGELKTVRNGPSDVTVRLAGACRDCHEAADVIVDTKTSVAFLGLEPRRTPSTDLAVRRLMKRVRDAD